MTLCSSASYLWTSFSISAALPHLMLVLVKCPGLFRCLAPMDRQQQKVVTTTQYIDGRRCFWGAPNLNWHVIKIPLCHWKNLLCFLPNWSCLFVVLCWVWVGLSMCRHRLTAAQCSFAVIALDQMISPPYSSKNAKQCCWPDNCFQKYCPEKQMQQPKYLKARTNSEKCFAGAKRKLHACKRNPTRSIALGEFWLP